MKENIMLLEKHFAQELWDNLAVLYIAANGGYPMDENGEFTEEADQLEEDAMDYADSRFHLLLSYLETRMGKKWAFFDREDCPGNCESCLEKCKTRKRG